VSVAVTSVVVVRFVLLLIVAVAAAVMLAIPLSAAPTASVPRLAHTVVIVFENHERGDILGSGAAPEFEQLASTYAQATADYAVAHPSLPNYLALVSGSTHGVTSDCTDCPQPRQAIGSQLSGG
jgi:phosphatidylinositol-3-phosphatase